MMVIQHTMIGSSSSSIKLHNRRAVLLTLLQHEPVSRVRIAELIGLSTTTVTNLIGELMEQGIVVENGVEPLTQQRGVGRPRMALHLVPEARFVVGVHIGVGSVRIAVSNLFARPLKKITLKSPVGQAPEEVLDEIVQGVNMAILQSGVDRKRILGVGIGATGMVDWETGVNIFAPNLGWHDVAIRDPLGMQLGLPVFVDNNVGAMALSETLFGAGKDVDALAFVYARIGVGAGFTIGGKLYRGEPCRCGNTGCLETLVSEPVIVRMAQELAAYDQLGTLAKHLQRTDTPIIECIFDAARENDPAAQTLLTECARYMGIGLANLVNMLSPEVIVLGGIFAQAKDVLFPRMEDTLRKRAFAKMGERVRLLTPTFGQDAGVVGAAALALDVFFYEQS